MASLIFHSSARLLLVWFHRAFITLTLPTSRGSTRSTCRVTRICLFCCDSEGAGCKLTGLFLHGGLDFHQEPAASLLFPGLHLCALPLRVRRLYTPRHLSECTAWVIVRHDVKSCWVNILRVAQSLGAAKQ